MVEASMCVVICQGSNGKGTQALSHTPTGTHRWPSCLCLPSSRGAEPPLQLHNHCAPKVILDLHCAPASSGVFLKNNEWFNWLEVGPTHPISKSSLCDSVPCPNQSPDFLPLVPLPPLPSSFLPRPWFHLDLFLTLLAEQSVGLLPGREQGCQCF